VVRDGGLAKRKPLDSNMSAIERHPDVPDNIFALEPHETIGDYARTYGDEITRRYENYNVIYIPRFPLAIDLQFFQALNVPDKYAKLGITYGIENGMFKRDGADVTFNHSHFLYKLLKSENFAGYLQHQIRTSNDQIREALRVLFPRYYSLFCSNITWRMTETPKSIMHIDHFGKDGAPFTKVDYDHKIKIFINIDVDARHWRTSFTLPEILARYRDQLSTSLPLVRNMIAWRCAEMDLLKDAPGHALAYPTMSAIIVNADVVSHQVVSGKRVIAGEFFCEQRDMLNPEKHPQARLPSWFEQYRYQSA